MGGRFNAPPPPPAGGGKSRGPAGRGLSKLSCSQFPIARKNVVKHDEKRHSPISNLLASSL